MRGCLKPLGAKIAVVMISIIGLMVKRKQRSGVMKEGREDSRFLSLRQCSLAFLLYTTWACQGRVSLDVEERR